MTKLEKFIDRHVVGLVEIFCALNFYGGLGLIVWMGSRSPLEAFAGAFGMLLIMASSTAYKAFKDGRRANVTLSYSDLCSLSIAWQKHTGLRGSRDVEVYRYLERLKEEMRKT